MPLSVTPYSALQAAKASLQKHFIFTATLILLADLNRRDPCLEEFISQKECLECIQIAHNFNASQEGSEGGFKGGFKEGFTASAPQIKALS
jgi:hypothetical protein